MNAADIAILAVLALSMLFGLLRGLVGEVLSLMRWVAAFWVAAAFGHFVGAWYGNWLRQPEAALIAGYVSCFLGVLVVGALLGLALHRVINSSGLRGGDHFLGMLFGLGRGLVLVTFVVLLLGFTAIPRESAWWQQSVLLPPFQNGAAWVARDLPPGVDHYLRAGGNALHALPGQGHLPVIRSSRSASPGVRGLPALPATPTSGLGDALRNMRFPPTGAGHVVPLSGASTSAASRHGPAHGDVGQ